MTYTPASRATDPASSHMAEAEINQGTRQSDCDFILSLVRKYPGETARELSGHTGRHYDSYRIFAAIRKADRYTVSRRLPDLEKRGLVRKGEIRKCRVGGRASVVWWPVPEQGELL